MILNIIYLKKSPHYHISRWILGPWWQAANVTLYGTNSQYKSNILIHNFQCKAEFLQSLEFCGFRPFVHDNYIIIIGGDMGVRDNYYYYVFQKENVVCFVSYLQFVALHFG